ncbi:MAG: YcaQ family DNA glycosylase [Ignavibacteria bacterium]|nr:YcaQ family DNA glycosylase [Ignavibacteria bacterium]
MKHSPPSKIPVIDKNTARAIILRSQMLLNPERNNDKDNIHEVISRLGYIQIDTISVTERSVNHILWSRSDRFTADSVNELFKEKKVFEYWSHAAAILPVKDFRYSLIFKKYYSDKYKNFKKENKRLLKLVLNRITSEGPLMSRDFEDKKTGDSGWWNRKPSKEALEFLFFSGELMVQKRINFQKVYDLTERVLPSDIDVSYPTDEQYHKHLILSFLYANGIAAKNEITYLRRYNKKSFDKFFSQLIEGKKIMAISVKGIVDRTYYILPEYLEMYIPDKSEINILSPFDNLIIQRKRIKFLFDFDYQLECYLPHYKRKFGYFSLPVLYRNIFIGRIDLKSDRKNKTLIINKFYPESNMKISKKSIRELNNRIKEYALFTGCEKVTGDL